MTRFVISLVAGCLYLTGALAAHPISPTPAQQLQAEVSSITTVSCSGASDGAIFLHASQGLPPYNFEWSTGGNEDHLQDIPAGNYSCTVSDANGEQVILAGIAVSEPAPLVAAISAIQHINCQQSSGALSSIAGGGTPGYQYLWNTGQTGAAVGQLTAGNYTVTVSDANGCTVTTGNTIIEDLAAPLADAGAPVQVACSNSPASLSGSGSSGPQFQYLWTAINGGRIAAGDTTLQPNITHTGAYVLRVTNTGNGCTATDTTAVSSQHTAPAATASGGSLTCVQTSVTLQASYGTPQTVFEWQGPNNFFSLLPNPVVQLPGNYVFTVTDTVTGCFSTAAAAVAFDTLRPAATATASGSISCTNPSISLMAWSGAANASFQWSGPGNYSAGGAQTATAMPGNYQVIATNPQNGCTNTAGVVVNGSTTPPSVSAFSNGTITCVTPSINLFSTVQPQGSAFIWTGPNGFSSTLQNPFVTAGGSYSLTATHPQNGCTAVAVATVFSDNTPPDLSASGGLKTCANPSVTLQANSATPGVAYSWTGPGNFHSTLKNPVVTQTGAYTVTVSNPSNGCSSSATVQVSANTTQPSLLAYGSTISCTNPIGKPYASSTTPGVSFAWSGPNGYSASGTNPPQVVAPGFYTVVVTNPANGCTNSTSVPVDDNTQPPYAEAGEDRTINCLGIAVLLNGSGSSSGGNYTYKWTTFNGHILTGASSLYPKVDATGTYTLKVTNNLNGCFSLDSLDVWDPIPVSATIDNITHVACFNSATGAITAKAGGGTGAYSFAWSNGNASATASGLSAGTYSVTITDTDGCSGSTFAKVNQPNALQATASATAQTTYGVNNGTASVVILGGTFPYTVKWSNNATTPAISGLAPGAYTVTVTDNNGCTIEKSAQVNAVNCTLSGSLSATQIACAGASNGSITVNLQNSINPVVYAWSNGAQTKTVNNLPPDTYTVTATDASGCSVVLNSAITSPSALALIFVSKENVPCPDAKSGLLGVGVSGGTAPYSFAWSNGNTAPVLTGLGPGAYTVTVTDTKGCTKSLNAQLVVTDQNPPLLFLKNASIPLDGSGNAVVTPALFDNGSYDAECSIAAWSVSPSTFACTQVGAHIVTLTATDAAGNSRTGTVMLAVVDNTVPALLCPEAIYVGACSPAVSFTLPQATDNCAFAPGQIQQTAGLPSGAVFPKGKTVQAFSCTDAGGNTAVCSFEIWVAPQPAVVIKTIPATCANLCDGSATLTPQDGTAPALIQWSDGQTGATVASLCAGAYTVTLTDIYGCTGLFHVDVANSNSAAFSLSTQVNPATCSLACDGSSALSISGGAQPYGIAWSNGQTGAGATDLCPGQYSATVTDANGCSAQETVTVMAVDNAPPSLSCPANLVRSYCVATVNYNPPVVQDNCPIDPQNLQLLSGLPSGSEFPLGSTTQVYRYSDSGGNSATCSFNVTVNGPADLNISVNDVPCAGQCNGAATVQTSGGFGPFAMLWNNGQGGPANANLCAGVYSVTVIDAGGCSQSRQISIGQPQALVLDVLQLNHETGNAGNGSILINASGGTPPYSFAWTLNGQAFSGTQNLSNLHSGQYAVLVTDANGCTRSSAALHLDNTVATGEAAWAAGLILQPNPASDFVRLALQEPVGQDAEVRIISPGGGLGLQQHFPAMETTLSLNVGALPAGLWLVHIRAADGRQTIRKLFVEHY